MQKTVPGGGGEALQTPRSTRPTLYRTREESKFNRQRSRKFLSKSSCIPRKRCGRPRYSHVKCTPSYETSIDFCFGAEEATEDGGASREERISAALRHSPAILGSLSTETIAASKRLSCQPFQRADGGGNNSTGCRWSSACAVNREPQRRLWLVGAADRWPRLIKSRSVHQPTK